MSRHDLLNGELVERCAELESALADVVLTPPERWESAQSRARETLKRVQARGLDSRGHQDGAEREDALAALGRLVRAVDRAHVLDAGLFDAWQAGRRALRRFFGEGETPEHAYQRGVQDAQNQEHNALELIDLLHAEIETLEKRRQAVNRILQQSGCRCACQIDGHWFPDDHDDCERCLGCRVGLALFAKSDDEVKS